MSAKEIFRKCRDDRRELLLLREKQMELRTSLIPRAIQYKSDVVQASGEADPLAERLADVVDMDRQIDGIIADMYRRESQALQIIRHIEDSRYRVLLMTYYMQTRKDARGRSCLHTLETAACVAGYSAGTIRHYHRRALKAAEAVCDDIDHTNSH